jgi:uncharacterized membrane protein YkvA (DUF1232 family)
MGAGQRDRLPRQAAMRLPGFTKREAGQPPPLRGEVGRHDGETLWGHMIEPPQATARQVVTRAARLPMVHRLRLAWRLARSRRVPLRVRMPLLALLLYLAMPLDIVPDFIPVLGQLDDVLVAGLAVWWFLRTCPPEVAMDEIERLEQTPLTTADRLTPWLLLAMAVGCLGVGLAVVAW